MRLRADTTWVKKKRWARRSNRYLGAALSSGPGPYAASGKRTHRSLSGSPTGEEPAAQYAVASALAHHATDMNFDRVYTYLNRMPVEFRVLAVRDASLRTPAIKATPSYTRWAIEHHHVLN
jgi:hypothetical protein